MSKISKKQLKAKNSKAVAKKITLQEAKDFAESVFFMRDDPQLALQKIRDDVVPQYRAGKLNKKMKKKAQKIIDKVIMGSGLDNYYPLAKTIGVEYTALVLGFSRQITKDYDCKTSGEKALAQVVVNAYIRILEYTRRLDFCKKIDYLSREVVNFYSMLSKELDRANRHFITALTTLKQLKDPTLKISVKTESAFIAENQQLNNIKIQQDENIKPK